MKNHLHSPFHIVHTLIILNLSRINSKSSGKGCAFYKYIYYKKNKIKNEFTIKPNSDLEQWTKLKDIIERIKFVHVNAFIYNIDINYIYNNLTKFYES